MNTLPSRKEIITFAAFAGQHLVMDGDAVRRLLRLCERWRAWKDTGEDETALRSAIAAVAPGARFEGGRVYIGTCEVP